MLWTPKDDKDTIREMERIHHQNMVKGERDLVQAGIEEVLKRVERERLEEVNRREQRERIEGHIDTIMRKAKGDPDPGPKTRAEEFWAQMDSRWNDMMTKTLSEIEKKAKQQYEDQSEEERETVQPTTKRRKRRNPKKTRR